MAKQVKRSVVPIYLVGLTWLVQATVFSLYSLSDYAFCVMASVVVFILAKMVFPDKEYTLAGEKTEKQEKPKNTGNPEIDALIKERARAVSEMRRLNDNIEDEKISAQIDHLEEVAGKIIDHVVDNPKKLPQIRRFLDYYLPTTLKILNAYDRMDSAGISGDNITATKEKVENMMENITVAFDKQLDSLFGDEAMDISTDITVMEQLLKQQGLGAEHKAQGDDSITLEL